METRTVSRALIIASGLLLLATAVCTLAGIILVPWAVQEDVVGVTTRLKTFRFDDQVGVFRRCNKFETRQRSCASLEHLVSWQKACQAMAILAAICILSALVLAPFYYCNIWAGCPIKRDVMTIIMILLCALTAIFLIVCLAVFNDNKRAYWYVRRMRRAVDVDLGAGFIVACLAVILALIAAILFVIIKIKNVRYPPH